MSEENVAESGATVTSKSANTEKTEVVVDRSPEEYATRLKEVSQENKKFREKYSKTREDYERLQSELQALREEKAKEQGQYKQMYEDLKSKYETESEQRKRDRQAFAFKTVTSQFAAEAAKAGCARVDDLIKLATADGLFGQIEVSDDDFNVTPDSLKAVVEQTQKSYNYLFAKPTPQIRDGVPNTNNKIAGSKLDLSNKSVNELIELAKNLPG